MKKIVTLGSLLLGVVFLAGCGQQQVSQTQSTTPAPVAQQPGTNQQPAASVTNIVNSDMKIYQNQQYGFEFQYPKAWTIDQERTTANEVVFNVGNPESREAIAFVKNDKKLTLEQLKATKVPDAKIIEKQSEMTIGGEKALVISTTEFGTTYIIFNHGVNTFTVTTGGKMIDEKILSTIKFTN